MKHLAQLAAATGVSLFAYPVVVLAARVFQVNALRRECPNSFGGEHLTAIIAQLCAEYDAEYGDS